MRFGLACLILTTLPILLSPKSNLHAQTTSSGSLTGTVTDPSDHVVPGDSRAKRQHERHFSRNND
jgi:hypothetical protein